MAFANLINNNKEIIITKRTIISYDILMNIYHQMDNQEEHYLYMQHTCFNSQL